MTQNRREEGKENGGSRKWGTGGNRERLYKYPAMFIFFCFFFFAHNYDFDDFNAL